MDLQAVTNKSKKNSKCFTFFSLKMTKNNEPGSECELSVVLNGSCPWFLMGSVHSS